MKKLAAGLAALMFVAMAAQAQDDCVDGATMDSAGNDCMNPTDDYVQPLTVELTQQQHAKAVEQMANKSPLAKTAANKEQTGQHATKVTPPSGPQAATGAVLTKTSTAAPDKSASSKDGPCAGGSDATGNDCK